MDTDQRMSTAIQELRRRRDTPGDLPSQSDVDAIVIATAKVRTIAQNLLGGHPKTQDLLVTAAQTIVEATADGGFRIVFSVYDLNEGRYVLQSEDVAFASGVEDSGIALILGMAARNAKAPIAHLGVPSSDNE